MDDHLLECFVQNLVMHSDSTTEPCISLTFLTENAQYPGCAKKKALKQCLQHLESIAYRTGSPKCAEALEVMKASGFLYRL